MRAGFSGSPTITGARLTHKSVDRFSELLTKRRIILRYVIDFIHRCI